MPRKGYKQTEEHKRKRGLFDSEMQSRKGKKGGLVSAERNRKRGKGLFDPEIQAKGRKAAKEKGVGFYNSELQSRLGKRGGRAVVKKYGGWHSVNKVFRERNPKKFYEYHSRIGKVGSKKAIETNRKNRTGFFDPTHRIQIIGGKIGGKIAQKTLREKGLGLYNPKVRARGRKKSVEINRKNKTAIFDPKAGAKGRQTQKEKGLGVYNPEIREKGRKTARINRPYYINGIPFDSRMEGQAMTLLCRIFNMIPQEGINCHVKVDGGEIDFRPITHLFIEFHPWDRNGLTKQEYYSERRKLLDENGFEKCTLIVIESLEELEGIPQVGARR